MDFIKKNIKTIGLIGCAILLVSNFLPFITAKASGLGESASESFSLMNEEIRIVGIIAIVIELLLTLLVAKNKRKLALIPVIIVLIFAISCKSVFSGESFDMGIVSGKIGYGIGFYAMFIGSILCIAFSFIKGENAEKPVETK